MADFDPELYRTIVGRAKRQLRTRMRGLRAAVPAEALAERNRALCARVSDSTWFAAADSIALFWPMLARNEVDLRPVDAVARSAGKRIFYPFMTDTGASVRTGFRLVDDPAAMVERGRGFLEPPDDLPEAQAGDIALILVPALAVSPDGHRLGYGAGFYDATLPEFSPPAECVSVAFDFQIMGELPTSEHDFACQRVLTDKREFARS